jgi:hypothetical protein
MKPGDAFDAAVAAKAADERAEVLKIAKNHLTEVLKLEDKFPDRQVSFVTLREALEKLKLEKAARVDQALENEKTRLHQEFEKAMASRVVSLDKREQDVKLHEIAIEQRGYDKCKREFMEKLGMF